MKNLFAIFLSGMLLFLVCTDGAVAQQRTLSPQAIEQIRALASDKRQRTPAQRKISSRLLFAKRRRARDPALAAFPDLRTDVDVDAKGSVLADIKADVSPALLAEIESLGGEVVNSFAQYQAIRARVPLMQIETLAGLAGVKSIRPANRAIVWKDNTSEGDEAHGADLARPMFGVDGTGTRLCVLSDGVDTLAARQGTGDLPPVVTILPGQAGTGDEGTAMLEIGFDLAPGADLSFATATAGPASFAENIIDLNASGCDVIVDDVGFPEEEVFEDGIIADAVNQVTATNPSIGGALYFSAAGDAGNLNDGTSGVWEGDFTGIDAPPPIDATAHNFGGGIYANTITKDPPAYIVLQWSDPFSGSDNDYDLYLLDAGLTSVIDTSDNLQEGHDDPLEIINSEGIDDTDHALVIVRYSGVDRYLHLNTFGGELSFATAGQIGGHSAAEHGFAVAAVDAASGVPGGFTGAESVETFSSDGPRRVFFDHDGTAITPGDYSSTGGALRQKPDIAAADGVMTATPGFNPFFGTSAAAPHAAAIAALLLEAEPDATQSSIRTVLADTAIDIEASGFDRDSGHGIVDAFGAIDAILDSDVLCGDADGNGSLHIHDLTIASGDQVVCNATESITLGPTLDLESGSVLELQAGSGVTFVPQVRVQLGAELRID
jgi:hypothetical protein